MKINYKTMLLLWLSMGLLVQCTIIEKQLEELKKYPESVNQQKILELVNEQRAKGCDCGGTYMPPVKPLKWDNLLEKAAQIHSDDMSKYNFLGHKGSDNSSVGERIYRVGYSWEAYGENALSKGFDEQEAVSRWIKSEGHCKNIMDASFEDVGVATKNGYWTMVFGRKK